MPSQAFDKSVGQLLSKQTVLRRELTECMLLRSARAWLFPRADFAVSLSKVLKGVMQITGADFGNIQSYDPKRERLKIVAHRGFRAPFLEFFNEVRCGQGTCGTAMKLRKRVFVRDVTADPIFRDNETIEVMLAAQARAVHSFPLIATSGQFVGMLSTHYRAAKPCTHHQLLLANILATNIADFIERKQLSGLS